ncbi:deoxynucleoside kinase [Pontibacter sp. G13]|uniref:deoxynucleoside kinase n=1 Tax=Pontibacter sp. G13 TaxID=3074898 RepID=UPI00288A5ACF|nr:deoxynucleoside kinase [Pontibacter sp. G13]WNJ18715.1 deoxynucleoside kinase [Pontibacter sp. G13]
MHISVAGNIGAGKTTLTYLLSKYFGFTALYEDNDQNPYLMDFYSDMQRWSFNLQVHFLQSRLKKMIAIKREYQNVIQDRTLYEDAQIFAPNLHAMGLLSARDYQTYKELFETIADLIQPPDLLIYLRANIPTLVEQIQDRGRNFEDSIRLDYLKRLNDRYEEWYDNYSYGKKMEVAVAEQNFRDDPEHLGAIINRVKGELYGLFS